MHRLLPACLIVAAALAGCAAEERFEPAVVAAPDIPEPVIDFTWTPEDPLIGQAVAFEPFGSVPETASITGWHWDFGDGEQTDVGAPLHRFGDQGLFHVSVRMLTSDGQAARASHVVSVSAGNVLDAREEAAAAAPAPDIRVVPGDVSVRFSYVWPMEPDQVAWDFGDGGTSSEAAPSHAYTRAGTFEVTLSVRVGSVVREAVETVVIERPAITFRSSGLGVPGSEPSIGVTSSGCIFFTAFQNVMRSCDDGASWEAVQDLFSQPTTSDPFLWVDPVTDRIFNVQMVALACTWIAWSDDDGASWLGNPWDCGPLPVNDHIKLGTGPWTDAGLVGYGALGAASPLYDQAVYFCYNKLVGVFCYTSFDGGATFPVGGQIVGLAGSGGLHGAISTAPDGTVYVPPRSEQPTVYFSKDNGLTWQSRAMGADVGTPSPRKNSEVAADTESNAYHTWTGADFGVYLARSTDSGDTWDAASLRVSPEAIVSSTFPHIVAGDPGRIAVAYLGSDDVAMLGQPDIDGQEWDGNPHTAPAEVTYDLYVTLSADALDDAPGFLTIKVTKDPVQVGSICISSGDCRDIGGSNRNLLDFNDLHIDQEGRIHIAFTDGCTGTCASSWQTEGPGGSRDQAAVAAILATGPSLFADPGTVTPWTA